MGDDMNNNEKVFRMKFTKIYSLLVQKAIRKNRRQDEVDQIIYWLTGYDKETLNQQLQNDVDYQTFFNEAPSLNPRWKLVQGTICRVKIESIDDLTMRKIRCLDKMVDELAKGKKMEKILR